MNHIFKKNGIYGKCQSLLQKISCCISTCSMKLLNKTQINDKKVFLWIEKSILSCPADQFWVV